MALDGGRDLARDVDLDKMLGLTAFPMNTVVALVIAICKASLVILFFMHVRYSSNLTKIVVVAGLFWLAILIALTFSDYGTRNLYIPNPPAAWDTSLPQVSR